MTRLEEFHGLRPHALEVTLGYANALPARGHHGGWLRGVLGHALFRGHCVHEQPRCAGCALRAGCPYPQAFKPAALADGAGRLPPYLVHAWRELPEQHRLRFVLVLLGPAVPLAGAWLYHLANRAGELDCGGGGPGWLAEARDLGSGALLFADGRFRPGGTLRPVRPALPPSGALTLRLHTPLVSKHVGDDPLLGPLRTRLQRLVNQYGDGQAITPSEPPWRVADTDLRTASVPVGAGSARRVRGLRGALRLTDVSAAGARLLAAGAYLHAGAEVTLGFGRYSWLRAAEAGDDGRAEDSAEAAAPERADTLPLRRAG